VLSESENATIGETERILAADLEAEYARDREVRSRHPTLRAREEESGWAVIDSVALDGQFPHTTLVVSAHLSLDRSRSIEVRLAVWDAESTAPRRMPDSIPGVILINLMNWTHTEARLPTDPGLADNDDR